jgi:hypothetical protein
MTNTGVLSTERMSAVGMFIAIAFGVLVAVLIGVLTGLGWLYLLRHAGWLSAGPKVGDSLPLLQLAGLDGEPLLAVLVAWILAGALTGLLTVRLSPGRRVLAAGFIALVLVLLASQASFALTRNLRFGDVLLHRTPGIGPWLEALVFALACGLPRRSALGRPRRGRGGASRSGRRALGYLSLSSGELRHAGQHDGNRDHMGDHRDGVRTQ